MSAPDGMGRPAIDAEALDWALRMSEPDADWDAFSAWLEEDASHSTLYDEAVLSLEVAADAVRAWTPYPAAADDWEPLAPTRQAGIGRRGWVGGAVAAALVAAVGLGVWQERDRSYVVATAAGERREIALGDGSTVAMAGGSRLRLDPASPRSVTMEKGQALFRVRHNAADPFRVHAGDLELRDLGTVFDVRLLGARTHVAVAEGAVLVEPDGANLRLDPGQSVTEEGGRLRRGEQDAADVGTWRDGRLSYEDATLQDVAEDLSRQLGLDISATPAVAARTFNGTLQARALVDDPAAFGALLGVEVRQTGRSWKLDARR